VSIDVTDATFETEIVARSNERPVIVDLWAPWCGPCKTLGPILDKLVDATGGELVLAKVNVDENPQTSAAFQVQSIPAVYALRDGKVVDGFVGAQGEAQVQEFVNRLLPTAEQTEIDGLLALGDEASLRAVLELDSAHEGAIVALAELLVADGRAEGALELLGRIPETAATRRVAALARSGDAVSGTEDIPAALDELLGRVKHDEEARQEFVDLLELLGAEDPRTADYRRRLTAQLF
jgi:putative thioredoxin